MSSRLQLGLRGQLLVGLFCVALLAVLTAGQLALLVVKRSYAAYEEEAARTIARSAGHVLAAGRDPARALREDLTVGRLAVTARELGRAGAIVALVVCDRDGQLLFDQARGPAVPGPPGGDDACRAAAVTTALAGVESVGRVEVGSLDGPRTELRVALPLRRGGGVEGAVRLTLGIDASLSGAEARSRWVLFGLGLLDGGIILILGALLLGRLIVRPIAELERAAERIARGAAAERVAEDGPGEVGRLAASFNRMTAALAGKVTELQARTGELAASREQLLRAEKLASVGRLAAGLAHEIGNPLSAMLGYVEILRHPGPAGPDLELQRDVTTRLHGEIERIHHIMQDLLAYSRPAPEEAQAVDAPEVVQAALALMRPQQRFKEVDLQTDLDPGLPPISASPGRLTQVLVNLLLNAADAVAGAGRVTVRVRRGGEGVAIEVADSGPGVRPEDRERIFDPFFTTKEPGQGTGLGLAISQSLCESFGASLTLRDAAPGQGATFVIQLRAATPG